MSADNGIYIAKFPDGFRVAHAMAIENIDYYPKGSQERKDTLNRYFGASKVFQTKEEAILEGHRMEEEIMNSDYPILEYGVSYIGEYEAWIKTLDALDIRNLIQNLIGEEDKNEEINEIMRKIEDYVQKRINSEPR